MDSSFNCDLRVQKSTVGLSHCPPALALGTKCTASSPFPNFQTCTIVILQPGRPGNNVSFPDGSVGLVSPSLECKQVFKGLSLPQSKLFLA